MGSESEVSVSKVKRTSKPKVRTGCITCKLVSNLSLLSGRAPLLTSTLLHAGLDESNAMKENQNVIVAEPLAASVQDTDLPIHL